MCWPAYPVELAVEVETRRSKKVEHHRQNSYSEHEDLFKH